MKEMLERLNKVTAECREDMHEPDEQGIDVVVTGYHLDNVMGDDPGNNCGEFTVGIRYKYPSGPYIESEVVEWFNLATLIALARKAKV